eukprot:3558847-Rhodomonas_salina.2
MSRTDLAYAAIGRYTGYAMPGTPRLSCYQPAQYCAMSSTDVASAGTSLRACYAMPGTELPYAAIRERRNAWRITEGARRRGRREKLVEPGISLRARYAMSGIELAYGGSVLRDARKRAKKQVGPAIGLRACYAMYGTGIAYAAIGLLRGACYAMPGTEGGAQY